MPAVNKPAKKTAKIKVAKPTPKTEPKPTIPEKLPPMSKASKRTWASRGSSKGGITMIDQDGNVQTVKTVEEAQAMIDGGK